MSQSFDHEAGNFALPVWASVFILAASLLFMIWYFVIYPIRIEKKMAGKNKQTNKLFFPLT
jgi:hypothetical protein